MWLSDLKFLSEFAAAAFAGSFAVVGTFSDQMRPLPSSCKTKSVKVPPMSKAKRIMALDTPCHSAR
jgi:hypothetical protein